MQLAGVVFHCLGSRLKGQMLCLQAFTFEPEPDMVVSEQLILLEEPKVVLPAKARGRFL